MWTPRIIAHPVMGNYVTVLLFVIVVTPLLYLFVSKDGAFWFSMIGTVAATMWLVLAAVHDHRRAIWKLNR